MSSSAIGAGDAALLELSDLSVHFGQRSAIEEISARILPAEIVSLVGPNGAGKSTILRVIAGILPPSHGVAKLRRERIGAPDPSVVYVPQRAGVDWTFPVSVLDVAMMGRFRRQSRWRPRPAADRTAALHALDQVGIAHLASVQIGTLSGGQQQRVFLARAILQGGELMLLDEPFAGVDAPTQELLLGLFRDFRARGMTILFATHDLAQASQISDRILLINRRMVAIGSPADVLTGENLRATFGGQAVLVPAHATTELPVMAGAGSIDLRDAG
jgi:ABC-type Mn2+/Zn2+ transport system ATPase subunit